MPVIIFVDDDKDEGEFFAQAISEISSQCVVNFTTCSKDFFDLLGKVSPDFIFLDIAMPERDGISCLKAIRNQRKYDSIPIVMYSNSESFLEECFLEQANFFIKKPKTYSGMVAALQQVIGSSAPKYKKTPHDHFLIK